MADGVEEVGLAQTGDAVDEQWVVGTRRRFGDREGGRVGETVGRADDEMVELVALVESVALDVGRAGPGPRGGGQFGERVGGGRRLRARLGYGFARGGRDDRLVGRRVRVHHVLDPDFTSGVLTEQVLEEGTVVGDDLLARQPAGDGQHELVVVQLDGAHALEPGLPRRLGQPRAQQRRRGRPQVERFLRSRVTHRSFHRCG